MNIKQIPIGFTVRTKSHQCRLTYRPDWSPSTPWVSYKKGVAGQHFKDIQEAIDNGWTNLENDADRENRAKALREQGLEIPSPLVSIPETNHLTTQNHP